MFLSKKLIIYGRKPVLETLESGAGIEKIFLAKNTTGDFAQKVRLYSAEKNIPLQYVPNAKLNSLTNNNHQGIIAYRSVIEYYNIEDILPGIYEKGELPFFLILDRISDVRNFGAIGRTAYGAGIHAIIIPHSGSALINADAVKTSAGALNSIPVCRSEDLLQTTSYLQSNGIRILAAESGSDRFAFQADLKQPIAIIMGSEDEGIQKGLLELSDEIISLPIIQGFDSYNVSVAAGMLLYEGFKQRMENK